MNIYDIAKKAGVSVATVSRVINNSSRVSERSKIKVKKIMEQEGYIPNVFARGLTLNSVRSVGILCPVISDINHAVPVSFLERFLRNNGFDTLLVCSSSYEEDKGVYLDLLLNKRVDAIICIGSTIKEASDVDRFAAAAKQVPIIIVNGLIECENIYCVLCDEESAARDCVHRLHAAGCDNIVYIYDTSTYSGQQKLAGYRRGVLECGIGDKQRLEMRISTEVNAIDTSSAAMEKLIGAGTEFSAIIAADDIVAVGAQKAMKRHGIQVPVIGFNNSRFAQCADPELTSVDNMIETLCDIAIRQLMDVLQGKMVAAKVVISAKLIERDTFRSQN